MDVGIIAPHEVNVGDVVTIELEVTYRRGDGLLICAPIDGVANGGIRVDERHVRIVETASPVRLPAVSDAVALDEVMDPGSTIE